MLIWYGIERSADDSRDLYEFFIYTNFSYLELQFDSKRLGYIPLDGTIEQSFYEIFQFDMQTEFDDKFYDVNGQVDYECFQFLIQMDEYLMEHEHELDELRCHINYGFQLVLGCQCQIDGVNGCIGKHNDVVKHASGDIGLQVYNGSVFRLGLV